MTYVVGQTIKKVITIRDASKVGVLGLTEDDFSTLEVYSTDTISDASAVTVDEVDDGQYILSFTPQLAGNWALHYVYSDSPIYEENTFEYVVGTTSTIVASTAGGTWTYTGMLDNPTDEIRFLIQDTDGDFPLFTDVEIAYALGASGGHTRRAAASLVERLMARYAQMADTTELDLSVRASQLYDHAKDLLSSLNSQFAAQNSVVPFAGGISNSDYLTRSRNTDRKTGVFDKNALNWGYGSGSRYCG